MKISKYIAAAALLSASAAPAFAGAWNLTEWTTIIGATVAMSTTSSVDWSTQKACTAAAMAHGKALTGSIPGARIYHVWSCEPSAVD